jgi:hypothetical protein
VAAGDVDHAPLQAWIEAWPAAPGNPSIWRVAERDQLGVLFRGYGTSLDTISCTRSPACIDSNCGERNGQ